MQVLLRMGFTHLELDNHFGGVAFLAWLVPYILTMQCFELLIFRIRAFLQLQFLMMKFKQ